MPDEAAFIADEAASIADVAALEADIMALEAASLADDDIDGVVTTGVVTTAGGVTTSSFLLQAAKDTAAARVTISNAVFMFLLDFKFGQLPVIVGTLVQESHHLQDKESSSISSA